jgi:hypothetical protein
MAPSMFVKMHGSTLQALKIGVVFESNEEFNASVEEMVQ